MKPAIKFIPENMFMTNVQRKKCLLLLYDDVIMSH